MKLVKNMTLIKAHILSLVAVLSLLLMPGNTRADLIFTLDSIIQGCNPGSEVVFTGTLTNTGNSPLYLNGIQFNFNSSVTPALTGDANVFLTNVPASLAAMGSTGDSYAGPIFGVNVAPATPPGTYTGSVTLTGGADGNASDILATQNFGVLTPASVPEASTLLGLSLGLMLGHHVVLRSRRKR